MDPDLDLLIGMEPTMKKYQHTPNGSHLGFNGFNQRLLADMATLGWPSSGNNYMKSKKKYINNRHHKHEMIKEERWFEPRH